MTEAFGLVRNSLALLSTALLEHNSFRTDSTARVAPLSSILPSLRQYVRTSNNKLLLFPTSLSFQQDDAHDDTNPTVTFEPTNEMNNNEDPRKAAAKEKARLKAEYKKIMNESNKDSKKN